MDSATICSRSSLVVSFISKLFIFCLYLRFCLIFLLMTWACLQIRLRPNGLSRLWMKILLENCLLKRRLCRIFPKIHHLVRFFRPS